MADLQAAVQAAADEMVAAGTETGLQIAVHRYGRVVADVVSGVAEAGTAAPVGHGTLFYAVSTAKGVAASLAHALAERGDIAYDLRLARVWPEFAAHGKEDTTLRHVLLPRVACQSAAPAPPEPPEQGSPLDRATPPALRDTASLGNRTDVLTADIPSLGTMTARGAARMYSALLGHVDGISLVSDQRRTTMAAVAFTGMDEVMGFPVSWAFGYSPDRPGGVPSRRGSTFGMVGANGSAAYADIDSGLAVAVMRNGPPAGGLTAVTRIDRLIAGTEEHQ